MKHFFLSTILLSLLFGCMEMKELSQQDVRPMIFQSEYTNYAWGYNHNGWIMESSGEVKRFQKKASWVFPDSLGYIAENDMQKNIQACDSIMAHVSPNDFTQNANKAFTCVNGILTKPKNTMADAGEHIYCFYLYDANRQKYKRFILDMTGDWSQENLAPNAKEVVEWMKTIK